MIPKGIFNQIFINYFLFCKEERDSTSFTFTEINLFSGKVKEFFLVSSLMLLISENLQGKGSSSPEIFPIYFRQAKFCYGSHYAILQLRTSLHLSKHEQNLSQYLIFIAINKAKWREKTPQITHPKCCQMLKSECQKEPEKVQLLL